MKNIDENEAQIVKLYKGKILVKFFPRSHSYFVDNKRMTGVTTYIGIVDKSAALVPWAIDLAEDHLLGIISGGSKVSKEDVYEACELHAVRKQQAADIGTIVHDWAEHYIKHKLKEKGYENIPELPEQRSAVIAINGFLDWEKEHKVKFVSSERLLYSKKHGYVGKMDIEAIIDGDLCLVDLKSSNGLYNSVFMQTAAYVKADEEESGKSYKGRWAVRLTKETEDEYLAKWKKKQDKDVRKGKEPREIPPFVAFEAKYLDANDLNLERDFRAFLHAKELKEWDKVTNTFYNKL